MPARATVAYVYGQGQGAGSEQFLYLAPDYVTQDTAALPYAQCTSGECISIRFDTAPSGGGNVDRVVAAQSAGNGVLTYVESYAAGDIGRAGIHVGAFNNTLSVSELGTWTPGSVLYLLDSRVGVFSYVSAGFITADTGPLRAASCLFTGGYACGGLSFDVGDGAGIQDVAGVRLSDGFGGDFQANLRFQHGAFGAAGTYYGANNTRLGVIALPGGVIPPTAVPEPETWALLLAGFALLGQMLRVRRRQAHAKELSHHQVLRPGPVNLRARYLALY